MTHQWRFYLKRGAIATAVSIALGSVALAKTAEPATGPSQAGPAAGSSDSTSTQSLEQVVVTGYRIEKQKDVLGAITKVNLGVQVEDKPFGNIMQALQGEIPGVQVITDGNPSGGASILIRGDGIGSLGFNSPLIIVDGVPLNVSTGLDEINPADIASIQILKDAASAAIYGARAANGVIVITTKQGSGHMRLDIKASQSYQKYESDITPLNTAQRAQVWYTASINAGLSPNSSLYTYTCNSNPCGASGYSNVVIGAFAGPNGQRFIDPQLTQPVSDTNWFDAVTQMAQVTDSTVSLSNASDDSKFYSSFGYRDAQGIVKHSDMRRFSLRINASHDLFDHKLSLGDNMLLTDELTNQDNSNASAILNQALETQSIIPIHTTTGGWGGPAAGTTDHDQPVYLATTGAGDDSRLNKVIGNLYADITPVRGLKLHSSVGVDYGQNYYRNYYSGGQEGNVYRQDNLTTSYDYEKSITVTDTADYNRTLWKNNNFDVLLGYENIDYSTEYFFGTGSGFASSDPNYTFLSEATQNINAAGGGDAWTLRSYFTNLSYNYKDKYLLSLIMRRDGSSRFGANNRWGYFPSVSTGWRISKEPWFHVHWINDMKFRVSDGTNGNQEIATDAGVTVYRPQYSTTSLFANPVDTTTCPGPNCQQEMGTAYDINGVGTGTLPSGFAKVSTGNPNLKWETSKQLDFGLDMTMFDDSLQMTLDVYRKRTSNILTTTVPLATAGEGAQQIVNGGTVDNDGLELELGYRRAFSIPHLRAPLRMLFMLDISKQHNKVVALPADVVSAYPGNGTTQTILGRSINSVYGYTSCGIFQNAAQVAAAGQAGAYVGGLRICDPNHDGRITAADQTFFGTTDPKFLYGFHFNLAYRNWQLSQFWSGRVGGLVYNNWANYLFPANNTGANWSNQLLSAWSTSNTGSSIPAPTLNSVQLPNSYFYTSGTYLKLRDVVLSYTPPEWLLDRLGMADFRLYLEGTNLLIFKPGSTTVRDPEVVAGQSFPIPRTYTVGFAASF